MRVTAKAQRSDGWWAVEVPEVPGVFTQARRLDQIPDMVRDAVALVSGKEAREIEIVVDPHTDLDVLVDEALAARRALDAASERAREALRKATRQLAESGFTVRDSGQLLGVSPQRVSQILDEAFASSQDEDARGYEEFVRKAVPIAASKSRARSRKVVSGEERTVTERSVSGRNGTVGKSRSATTGRFTSDTAAAKGRRRQR